MAFVSGKIIFLCLTFLGSISSGYTRISTRDTRDDPNSNKQPIVFLTVSSLASESKHQKDRMLELNWENIQPDDRDGSIQLHNSDPSVELGIPLESVHPVPPEGHHRTSVRFPEQFFNASQLTDDCLGFWIAHLSNGQVLASNCLRARPHWMEQSSYVIGNLSLMDLMIPGTHNTGSYARFDPRDDTLFNRYLLTQEEDVWHQLVYGIRYLDLRVAYRYSSNSPELFWITHSTFVTDVSIKDVIQQVKQFMEVTNEIVFMDFHRFVTGFQGKRGTRRHRDLIRILEEELGEHMIPTSFTMWPTLEELWAANRTLFVGYANNAARRRSQYLFPAIRHLWGDVDSVEDLYDYFNQTICSQQGKRLTSAMAQLTPTTAGAIFNIYGGLRDMADSVNRQVTKWFRDEFHECANIVATDFFLGNNMIEVAIERNKNVR